MIFDTHTHMYFTSLLEKEQEVQKNLKTYGVSHCAQIGTNVITSQQAIDYAKKYNNNYATVGLHPLDVQLHSREKVDADIATIEELYLQNTDIVVAFGEAGLDHYHLDEKLDIAEQKEIQIYAFQKQIELANKYDKYLVIHSREAREDTLFYIKEFGLKKPLIHCYSYNLDFAQRLLEIVPESYFAFGGVLTYNNAQAIQEAATMLPLDRILLETDAPFLVPQQIRSEVKLNESAYTAYVLEFLQSLRNESHEEVKKQVFKNSLQAFWL